VPVTRDAAIRLPPSLDSSEITIEPNLVSVEFQIQSKTQKAYLPFVRVLIAGPAEEYAAFSITLPRVIVPKVEIESDTDIIDGIKSGKVTVFAIVRLKSSELEDRITEKAVTTFLAFTEDGAGHVVKATVEDPAQLNIELKIEKIEKIEKKEEIAE
jgi:YbbR domain-containing protein